jgi:5S rRNA maturation endonuclease (ribonuclease M5)
MTVQLKQKQKRGGVIYHILFEPATGEARWRHCRQYYAPDADHPEPWKEIWWQRLDANKWVNGLDGLPTSQLPLWNAHLLRTYAPNLDVILCEGEKAAQALTAAGQFAVATVCGAEVCPAREVLSVLAGRRVLLWRDHDTPGVKHMREIARELGGGIAAAVRWVDWKQAPPMGDAADFVDQRGASALRDLLSEALIEEPPFTAPAGEHAPRYAGARGNGEARADTPVAHPQAEVWPAPLEEAAFHGPLGDLTRLIGPESEADEVAILASLLVGGAAVIGGTPYTLVNDTRHTTVLYAALVGRSAMARKGTARDHARAALAEVDAPWVERRCVSGLSSGEGLIYEVRDPRPAQSEKEKDDPGEEDKRLLVVENELARTLRAGARRESTLTAIITDAFDGKPLATRVLKNPLRAATHHICLLAMITRGALARELSTTDMTSGFANRFLWLLVRRSKKLPEGGHPLLDIPGVPGVLDRIAEATAAARRVGRMQRDDAAKTLWADAYTHILSVDRIGLLGDVTNRADALALRLSMVYALMDCSATITVAHVQAALAVVAYSMRSCEILFGGRTGNTVADRLLLALVTAGEAGLTQTEIFSGVFGRNIPSSEIASALGLLEEIGRAYFTETKTGGPGRPVGRWFIRDQAERRV